MVITSPLGLLLNVQLPPLRNEVPVAKVSSMNCRYVHRPFATLAKMANGEVTTLPSTMDLYVKRPNIATCSPEPNCASTAKACFSQYRPTSTKVLTMLSGPLVESVRRLQAGLHSFLSMRRIEARRKNASAFRLRFSQSLASLRQRLSQAMVRSTIQRFGKTTNPLT